MCILLLVRKIHKPTAGDGHALIYENNDLLAESERFAEGEHMITADIDLDRLMQDRMRSTKFHELVGDCREPVHSKTTS